MNYVQIRGGLTRDPELSYGQYGNAMVFLTVAVNGARYDGKEKQQVVTTTFVAVTVFGPHAEEIAETMGKGDEVYVQGEIDQRQVEKEDGTKEQKTRVTGWLVQATRPRSRQTATTPRTEGVGEEPF